MSSVLNCTERKKGISKTHEWIERKPDPNSAESSFSNKSVKSGDLRKWWMPCQKALIREIKSYRVSQKFNLWTVLKSKKPGRPENDLIEYEVEWLCQFMDRLNVTYTNLWKKDQRYIGKENGKIKISPICYFLWIIRDLIEIINGCSGILQRRRFSNSFQKLTFRQLY